MRGIRCTDQGLSPSSRPGIGTTNGVCGHRHRHASFFDLRHDLTNDNAPKYPRKMGRAQLTWLFIGFVLAASTGGCFDDPKNCSPCPPGTRSNPAVPCSVCVPIDGGADASDAP